MTDDLKTILRHQLDGDISHRPQRNLAEVERRGRRKRIGTWASTFTVVVALAIATVAIIPRLTDDVESLNRVPRSERNNAPAGPSLMANGCPKSKGRSSSTRWSSPTTFVAGGQQGNTRWALCARTVESLRPKRLHDEGLCMDWLFGEASSGMTCVFTYTKSGRIVPLDRSYFSPTSGPEWGYFFGAIPADAASVEFVTTAGEVVDGQIHPAPEELRVPFRFFTLIAKPYAEGTLILRDDEGNLIREREMKHGLSILTIHKEGEGNGQVSGYRTEELLIFERCQQSNDQDCREPRVTWIDCGQECTAALAEAQITLFPRPGEGSTFTGWSGACTGTGECELLVDENLDVTATFEPSG